MSAALSVVPEWHEQFVAVILPAVEAIARRRFHGLPVADREESTAEAIAAALVAFVRLIRRGKDPAVFAGRLAQVAVLKVLEGRLAGSPDRINDVFSRYGRQRRGFQLEHLDNECRREGQDWESALVENWTVTPADLAASRIDFREWLGRMKSRRREIAESLAAGYRTEEVAVMFRISRGRVSQIRREFEASWEMFQSDVPDHSDNRRPMEQSAA